MTRLLDKSPHPRELWTKFNQETFQETHHIVFGSPVSRTDAVLTRSLSPVTGEQTTQREITIYLKKHPKIESTALDLIHELVHAVLSKPLDPYTPDLNLRGYITQTLEGPGGEIEAVYSECQFLKDQAWENKKDSRCERYLNKLSRAQIRADFYRVGEHKKMLDAHTLKIPITSSAPIFISSTGNAPYPVALYYEYQEINRQACENARRRIASTQDSEASAMIQARCVSHRKE
ncbi:MAG: hypothetical protein KA715_08115 [Xanthomonadaceae bacterium]|nr:hypothetical protein [Xanthomonadaceae bacterium]